MTGVEIALIAGMAISAAGAISAGNAQKKAADYNAAVGRVNAKVTRQTAGENYKRQQRMNAKQLGSIRNTDNLSMDVLEDSVREAELMSLDILYAGEIKAMGLESGATLDTMKGKAAQRAGYFSAAGSLLKGAGGMAGAGGGGGYMADTGSSGFASVVGSGQTGTMWGGY